MFKTELAQVLAKLNSKDQAAAEKSFINGLIVSDVEYRHRHYVQDNEYIPHGEDIQSFLEREIAKPIIRWQDSPQLGYEILPNKYFPDYVQLSANSSDFRVTVIPAWTAGNQSTGMYPATGV